MKNASPLPVELLLPCIPSSSTVLAYVRDTPCMLSAQECDHLLAQWSRWPFAHKEEQFKVSPLVLHLMEVGANPWRVEGLMENWVRHDRMEWARHAFALVEEKEHHKLLLRAWLHEAVERSSPMVELLLSLGAPQLYRGKDGATPLHLAKSPSIVSQLCRAGADISATDYRDKLPIETWLNPFKGNISLNDLDSYGNRIAEMFRAGLWSGQVEAKGLAPAPLMLAAVGSWQLAAIAGRVCSSGLEIVPCADARFGASPLAGWAWSVFQDKLSIQSLASARTLLDGCFSQREGTWDHEWVLATAAIEHLYRSSSCHPATRSSMAADHMRHVVACRLEELSHLPALEGAGTRLDAALADVAGQMAGFGWLGQLCSKAGGALAVSAATGRKVAGIDAARLHAFVSKVSTYSSWKAVDDRIKACWSSGIPNAFWTEVGEEKPEWMKRVNQDALIAHARKSLAAGHPLPSLLTPLPSWPADVAAAVEALEISNQTTPARGRPSFRRM